jgi:hypothetical protein
MAIQPNIRLLSPKKPEVCGVGDSAKHSSFEKLRALAISSSLENRSLVSFNDSAKHPSYEKSRDLVKTSSLKKPGICGGADITALQ